MGHKIEDWWEHRFDDDPDFSGLSKSEVEDYVEDYGNLPECDICGEKIFPDDGGICFWYDPDTGKAKETWWCRDCVEEAFEHPDIDWEAVDEKIEQDIDDAMENPNQDVLHTSYISNHWYED